MYVCSSRPLPYSLFDTIVAFYFLFHFFTLVILDINLRVTINISPGIMTIFSRFVRLYISTLGIPARDIVSHVGNM